MVAVAPILVNGLVISSLYALVAVGFTMIFGVGGTINLAHGAVITVGAFAAYSITSAGFGVWAGALAAMVVPAVFSVLLYKGFAERRRDNVVVVMILTLLASIGVEELVRIVEGTQPRAIPPLVAGTTNLLGTTVQNNLVVVFVLSWVLIGGLFGFINYTNTGKAILATSMSTRGAALVGIESDRVNLYTWAIAGLLAGLAGLFLGSYQTASWAMGRDPLVLSFSIVVLGGLGSIRGSLVAAYVIGFLEVITTSAVDPRLSGLAGLVVLVAVLLVKPEGLFGREFTEA
ncbi:branched-chain amino acid ABC transporter permease [Halococcus hamelinensis]|uniref:Branched-chain/neutral amino acids ABC transporter permease n=1 Tax=Halococcus hamelinensis 100A6 TaxID=1132509 RepID=M0LZB8_9EURY|nr:branched-chain amino acid ABC transporter permease [Halococcus hamelinensis]EMA38791.1 branched-chain/neutral amino acids ABC transporter permease [Halococcus hamelinensis 100A6]